MKGRKRIEKREKKKTAEERQPGTQRENQSKVRTRN
jgi:hypothetical protein